MTQEDKKAIKHLDEFANTTMESPLQLKTSKKWCPLKNNRQKGN